MRWNKACKVEEGANSYCDDEQEREVATGMSNLAVIELQSAVVTHVREADVAVLPQLAALRESEERFRSAFQYAAIGSALVALDGRWMQVNASLCAIVGYTDLELLSTTFQAITHPEDLEADLGYVRQLLAGEIQHYNMAKRYHHKQGHVVWVMLSASIVRNDAREPLYFIAQMQDITEQKRVEALLIESEGRFRGLFDQASDAVFVTDPDTGAIVDANRRASETLSYSRKELLKMRVSDIELNADPQRVAASLPEIMAGHPITFDGMQRRRDRSTFPVEVRISRIEWGGRPMILALARDVTDRKRVEEGLRQNEELLRSVVDNTGDCIKLLDLDGRLQWMNACGKRLLEIVDFSTLQGKYWTKFWEGDDRLSADAAVAEAKEGRPGNFQGYCPTASGKPKWWEVIVTPVLGKDGKPERLLSVSRDITERKRSEVLEQDRREVLEMVTKGRAIREVLIRIAGMIERQVSDVQATVLLLHDGMLCQAAPTLAPEFLHVIERRALSRIADLTSGQHLRPTVNGIRVTDLLSDDIWSDCRDIASKLGLLCCWSLPVYSSEGMFLGMIAVYSSSCRGPGVAEQEMLHTLAGLATISIEHRQIADQLAHRALHDPLTGLPNRVLFEDRLQQAIASAKRTGTRAALMAIDLDRFKTINDTYGHEAGDSLLQQFSQRLMRVLRETDTLARVGGDEFMLILPEVTDESNASAVAEKVLNVFSMPFRIGATELPVTGSVGLSIFPEGGQDPAALQRCADSAMYEAKRNGRNRFAIAAPIGAGGR